MQVHGLKADIRCRRLRDGGWRAGEVARKRERSTRRLTEHMSPWVDMHVRLREINWHPFTHVTRLPMLGLVLWRAAECIGADGDFQILYIHASTRCTRIVLSAHLPDTRPHRKDFFLLDGEVPFSPKVSHGLSSVGTSHPMRFLASANGSSCSNSRELCEKENASRKLARVCITESAHRCTIPQGASPCTWASCP